MNERNPPDNHNERTNAMMLPGREPLAILPVDLDSPTTARVPRLAAGVIQRLSMVQTPAGLPLADVMAIAVEGLGDVAVSDEDVVRG